MAIGDTQNSVVRAEAQESSVPMSSVPSAAKDRKKIDELYAEVDGINQRLGELYGLERYVKERIQSAEGEKSRRREQIGDIHRSAFEALEAEEAKRVGKSNGKSNE